MKSRTLWLGSGAAVALLAAFYVPGQAAATEPCMGVVHERAFLRVESVEIDGVATDAGTPSDLAITPLENGRLQARVFDPETGVTRELRGVRR